METDELRKEETIFMTAGTQLEREKQWMDNAQNIGNWGENQMVVANTRIPYASTLQLEAII